METCRDSQLRGNRVRGRFLLLRLLLTNLPMFYQFEALYGLREPEVNKENLGIFDAP